MRIGLLVLMGIPASGKTKLSKTLANEVDAFHFIHVSYDEFIPVKEQIREFEWKTARFILSLKIERLIVSIKNRDVEECPEEFRKFLTIPLNPVKLWNNSNVVLIIDDNMYFRSMRYSLFKIARRQNISFGQVYINCPLCLALFRNNLRSERIPPQTIENMHRKIEPPNLKNKWERYSVELPNDWDLVNIKTEIIPMLSCCLEHSFSEDDGEEGELSKLQCRKSVLHQVDIGLRKVVGCKIKKFISENSKQECREYIDSLNVRKSEILADIKSGNIHLPENILKEIEDDVDEKLNLIEFLNVYI